MTLRKLSSLSLVLLLLTPKGAIAQRTKVTHTVVNIAASSTQALVSNVNRNFLIIENDSNVDIYCAFNVSAVVSQGLRITAFGGALLLDNKFPTTTLNCIHNSTGTKTLLITEGVQ